MSIYDRPMFRKKGGATGIMASGPNMIKAALGTSVNLKNQIPSVNAFNYGILPVGTANASPILTGNIPPNVITEKKFELPKTFNADTKGFRGQGKNLETGTITSVEQKTIDEEEPVGDAASLYEKDLVGGSEGSITNKINEANKKILDKKITKNQEIVDEKTGDVVTTTEDDASLVGTKTTDPTSPNLNNTETKASMQAETEAIQKAFQEYNKDLNNIDNALYLGKTHEEYMKGYMESLNKKPEEVTFADVRDSAFEMLGYDKDKLDENLDKDRQGAIWLNLMRAGLAMAAGESPNTLTNVAKGFQIGLEGYGRDLKVLDKNYRKDVERYQDTMYRFLRDKKSENIAMNALDVQRKAAEFAVIQQTRGEKRKDLLDKLNQEVTMRKLKLNTLSTFAQLDLEKKKFDKSSQEFEESKKIQLAKIAMMAPKEITLAQTMGYVELIDESKPPTAENLKLTQKAVDASIDLLDILKKTSKKSQTEYQSKVDVSGEIAGEGIVYNTGDKEPSSAIKTAVGSIIQKLDNPTGAYQKALSGNIASQDTSVALAELANAYRPLKNKYGDKILLDYNQIHPTIKKAIDDGDADTLAILNANSDLFTNYGG